MNDLNALLKTMAQDSTLKLLDPNVRYELAHSLLGEQLMDMEFASIFETLKDKVEDLPRTPRTLGTAAVATIQEQATKLDPAMVRNGDDFRAIANAIHTTLSDLRSGSYPHIELKVREIKPRLREWFVGAYAGLVPSLIAQRIKRRPHPALVEVSFSMMVGIAKAVVLSSLGRPMDTTNTKLLLSSRGDFDVISNPPLWAVVNDACALMELDESSNYFVAFSHALVPWLCKIEVNVYQILFGSVKELEAIYGKNA